MKELIKPSQPGNCQPKILRVCYFGFYNRDYSRNKILIGGLRANGLTVIECHSAQSGPIKYFDLFKKHWRIRKNYDVMVVGFPGQVAMIMARLITLKPIIFDAFLSFYDSMVFDRQICPPRSFRSFYFWLIDWLSCLLANRILLDTNEHIKYFIDTFKIKEQKFRRIFIGADENVFYPRPAPVNNKFTVNFHGTYIPLQGIKYIIEAAAILREESILFRFIGSGQQFKEMEDKISILGLKNNVEIVKFMPVERVADYLSRADICLGIFGDTPKAKRVIPNKLYEGLAMKKPVISARTVAIDEVFRDRENILLCEIANGQDLAKKIILLKNDKELFEKIAASGYKLYNKKFNSVSLGKELHQILKELI